MCEATGCIVVRYFNCCMLVLYRYSLFIWFNTDSADFSLSSMYIIIPSGSSIPSSGNDCVNITTTDDNLIVLLYQAVKE